ncbi:MAG: hypothetical protein Q4D16_18205 [Eubacteriales bacterium]|nr:hypothetical protein [Eubacteriales bacterium]
MMSMVEKLKKSKRYLAVLICAVMLMGNAVPVMAADLLQLKDYFYVSVWKGGVANSLQPTAENGIIGGITDWGQAVSTGEVNASLARRSGAPSSTITSPDVEYTWTLVKTGQKTIVLHGTKITVPSEYAGGYMDVQAYTSGNRTWAESTVISEVTIS